MLIVGALHLYVRGEDNPFLLSRNVPQLQIAVFLRDNRALHVPGPTSLQSSVGDFAPTDAASTAISGQVIEEQTGCEDSPENPTAVPALVREGRAVFSVVRARVWGARSLGFVHHLYDLGQQCVCAHPLRRHDKAASPVDRASDHLGIDSLLNRDGFAADHRLVHGAAPFGGNPIRRDLFTRPHAKFVANLDRIQIDIALSPVPATRRAVLGASPSSALIAPLVRLRAFNSRTCPRSTSTVMTAAASK